MKIKSTILTASAQDSSVPSDFADHKCDRMEVEGVCYISGGSVIDDSTGAKISVVHNPRYKVFHQDGTSELLFIDTNLPGFRLTFGSSYKAVCKTLGFTKERFLGDVRILSFNKPEVTLKYARLNKFGEFDSFETSTYKVGRYKNNVDGQPKIDFENSVWTMGSLY